MEPIIGISVAISAVLVLVLFLHTKKTPRLDRFIEEALREQLEYEDLHHSGFGEDQREKAVYQRVQKKYYDIRKKTPKTAWDKVKARVR